MNYVINSFNSGELSPLVLSRPELEKYKDSCKELTNFIPLPLGGVSRRPGTSYLGGSALGSSGQSRLLEFQFNVNEGIIIELYENGMRFWTNGALIAGAGTKTTPYLESELFDVKTCQINDVVYFVHENHPVYKLSRFSNTNWVWQTVNFKALPFRDSNVSPLTLRVDDEFAVGNSTLRASDDIFDTTSPVSKHAGSTWRVSHDLPDQISEINLNGITYINLDDGTNSLEQRSFTAGDYVRKLDGVVEVYTCIVDFNNTTDHVSGFDSPADYPDFFEIGVSFTAFPYALEAELSSTDYLVGSYINYQGNIFRCILDYVRDMDYVSPNIDPAFYTDHFVQVTQIPPFYEEFVYGEWEVETEEPTSENSKLVGNIVIQSSLDGKIWTTEAHLNEKEEAPFAEIVVGDFTGSPRKLRIVSFDGVHGGDVTFTRKAATYDGLVKINSVTDARTADITILRELVSESPTKDWAECSWSNYRGWPRTVFFSDNRLIFGGNWSEAQTLWFSQIGDLENFNSGLGNDDQAIQVTIASNQYEAIQWINSQRELIVGTSGGEWLVASNSDTKSITPSTLILKRQSAYGSEYFDPLVLSSNILYLQRGGRTMRSMQYSFERDSFVSDDMTVLAEHITTSGIKEMTHQRNRFQTVWAVLNSGDLISMTYDPSQRVYAWARHETDGEFESVAVISTTGNEDDEVWFSVKREVNGSTVRYVERFNPDSWRLQEASDQRNLIFTDCTVTVENDPASTTVSGLSALEGKDVQVIADGGQAPDATVSSGSITLSDSAELIHVGLPFVSTLETAPLQWVSTQGSTQGTTKRITKGEVKVYKSLLFDVYLDNDTWDQIDFRVSSDDPEEPLPLKSQTYDIRIQGNHTKEPTVKLRQAEPLPLFIQSVSVRTVSKGL